MKRILICATQVPFVRGGAEEMDPLGQVQRIRLEAQRLPERTVTDNGQLYVDAPADQTRRRFYGEPESLFLNQPTDSEKT